MQPFLFVHHKWMRKGLYGNVCFCRKSNTEPTGQCLNGTFLITDHDINICHLKVHRALALMMVSVDLEALAGRSTREHGLEDFHLASTVQRLQTLIKLECLLIEQSVLVRLCETVTPIFHS